MHTKDHSVAWCGADRRSFVENIDNIADKLSNNVKRSSTLNWHYIPSFSEKRVLYYDNNYLPTSTIHRIIISFNNSTIHNNIMYLHYIYDDIGLAWGHQQHYMHAHIKKLRIEREYCISESVDQDKSRWFFFAKIGSSCVSFQKSYDFMQTNKLLQNIKFIYL